MAQKGWQPGFNTPGLNGEVLAVTVYNRHNLITAGNFTDAGGHLTADYAAHWNGHTWHPLGRGPGIGPDSWVSAALCLPGGVVVLAVQTYGPSSSTSGFVTRWNGHHWQHLGPDFPTKVQALTVDAHGDLLVAVHGPPDFSARTSGVLRWNWQCWQPLGPNDPADTQGGSTINQLIVLPTGDLVASGHFAAAGQRISGAARWTGTTWQRLGPDVSEPEIDFRLILGATGELINLTGYPSRPTRWDGSAWQPLSTGLSGQVDAIRPAPLTQEWRATGRFTLPGDTTTRRVARWDGTRWQPTAPLPGALASVPAYSKVLAQLPNGEVLVVRGRGLSWWNGSTWQDLASYQHTARLAATTPDCDAVQHVAVAPNGALYLASSFYVSAPVAHHLVERKKGHHVQPLGAPLVNEFFALTVASNGDAFAGVNYNQTGAYDSANYVACWDGRRWQPLRESPADNTLVAAPNGDLVAGSSSGVARWNGHAWQHLGPAAPDSAALIHCRALAIAANGNIIAGGRFICSNRRRATGVVRWNGTSWQHLRNAVYPNTGDGFDWQTLFERDDKHNRRLHDFEIDCLVEAPNGDIIASGRCWDGWRGGSRNPRANGYVARWNGTEWQAMGPELDGAVNAMAVAANGDVIIGGDFQDAGAVNDKGGNPAADYIARWHDGAWQPLGAGLDGEVKSLVVAPNGDIIVGGTFTATNDGLAMWHFGVFRDR